MGTGAPSSQGFRFPAEIISHCAWLYYRFPLSVREVEEMMLARGVTVSYETIRQWTGKFGQAYANGFAPSSATPCRHRHRWTMFVVRAPVRGRARPDVRQPVLPGEGW